MGYRISPLNAPPGLLIAFGGAITAATLVDAIGEAATRTTGGAAPSLMVLPEDLPR